MRENGARNNTILMERVGGIIFFISFVAAYFVAGASAAVKVLGVAAIFVGLVWFLRRRVPFGVEGEAPIGEIRGYVARIMGVAMLIVGLLLFAYSIQVACSVGWAEEGECFRSS